jgi:hypothetical protein
MPKTKVNGVSIAYEVAGEGPPIGGLREDGFRSTKTFSGGSSRGSLAGQDSQWSANHE